MNIVLIYKFNRLHHSHANNDQNSAIFNLFTYGSIISNVKCHSPGSTCIELDFEILQVPPTQVSPRGGCCIWRPMG
ncbi:hypothetical protein HZH68_004639 [Vespula germanica]|uniref:Uncharacterized protein n=1 Tax=Vespula germanica TaxID=30212 RepID=A0A834KP67_VESGE|nr:hypothetical protein HZH68_004639 [Vespula germanica]